MKNLLILPISLSFATSALAQSVMRDTASPAISERVSSLQSCAIAPADGGTAVDFSFGSSSPPRDLSSGMSSGKKGYDYYLPRPDLQVSVAPPSADGLAPTVTWHAIKTKGAGGDRQASPNGRCDAASASALQRGGWDLKTNIKARTISSSVSSVSSLSCSISSDSVSVHIVIPASSKVVLQDLHIEKMVSGGPGGGPRVLSRAHCDGPDGKPSDMMASLLLPAVQK